MPYGFDKTVRLGTFGFLARPLLKALQWIHANVVANYGWAIVLLTTALKIVLLPLSLSAFKSMRKMQKLNPKMQAVREAGGKPLMWQTGHSLVKAKLAETGAPLAGEMSGHIFFGERWYGFDDATYTAARLLEILSRSRNPSQVLNALPTSFSTPELNVPCAEGEPKVVVQKLLDGARFPGAKEIITIDGLRAEYEDGFGLIRSSNTTPVLVLRFDADSRDALVRIQQTFRAQLLAIDPELVLPF
jgi:hypothetical protein